MVAFIITVPTTCSRPSTKMVGFLICLFVTVPTTCSRPSTKMVAFMFIFYFLRDFSPDHTVAD